jgi:hypothetical protein
METPPRQFGSTEKGRKLLKKVSDVKKIIAK